MNIQTLMGATVRPRQPDSLAVGQIVRIDTKRQLLAVNWGKTVEWYSLVEFEQYYQVTKARVEDE